MIELEYLSIAEFAEAAGITKQAVYKQVNNKNSRLSKYLLREGKKILIRPSALIELYGVDPKNTNLSTARVDKETTLTTPEVENTTQPGEDQPRPATAEPVEKSTPVENATPEIQPISTDYIEYLKAQISELKEEKARSEERLTATIQEKDNIIKQQTQELASLAQQVAQIANKALIATSQQQYLTAMEKGDKQDSTPAAEPIIVDDTPEDTEPPKKGFWKKFFG